MRNCIRPDARSIPMVVPYAGGILSGQGMLVGAFFGVAASDAAQNASVDCETRGEFELTKEPALAISQGARVLSDVVPSAIAALPPGLRDLLRVAHQARAEDAARVVETYAAAGVRAEVQPFFTDIPRRLSEAQLVISRSGASSVADISVIGRPSILIPFAAATGDHQTANARFLANLGAAKICPQATMTPDSLKALLEPMLNRQFLMEMAMMALLVLPWRALTLLVLLQ